MTKLRTALTVGVVVVAGIGAAAGFAVVYQASPEAARSLLAVDAGVLVALAVTVWVLLGPLSKRIDELVEALRALARGEKHTRVEPADFAGLAEIARATNEVGAYLCENDDPNLGPVLKRSRDHVVEVPQPRRSASETRAPPPPADAAVRASRGAAQEISEHPEIGAVRVRSRDAARPEVDSPTPIIDGESVSEARPTRRRSTKTPSNDGSKQSSSKTQTKAPASPSSDSTVASSTMNKGSDASAPSTTATTEAPKDVTASPTSDGGEGAIPVSLTSEPPTSTAADATSTSTPKAAPMAPGPAANEPMAFEPTAPASTALEPTAPEPTAPARTVEPEASASSSTSPAPSESADLGASSVDEAALRESAPGGSSPIGAATVDAAATADGVTTEGATPSQATNDTVIEPARPAPVSIPTAPGAQLPTRDELLALFNEFVRAKKAAGVDDGLDVDFDAFADTIRGESERLIHDHACRGVRFEVAIADGEVSLRPRLVR